MVDQAGALPLQQGLALGNQVAASPLKAVILRIDAADETIRVKAGIFYASVIAGCSCADDPTPVEENTEYCVVQLEIDRRTAAATVGLLDE